MYVCMYIYHIYIHIHTYVHIRIHKYLDSSNCNWMHDDSCTIHAQVHPCQYWMIWFVSVLSSLAYCFSGVSDSKLERLPQEKCI